DIRIVRNTLNAGATLDRVQRVGKDASHYWVHKDLYKTLARIRARSLVVPAGPRQIAAPSPQGNFNFGGSLTEHSKAIEHSQEHTPEEATALRSRYIAKLLDGLNLDASVYEDLPGPAFGAAIAASEAFGRARSGNPRLDHHLTARDDE